MNRLVQEGPRDAKLVVCGEAPGAREDSIGKPFQGGAGWVLNELFDDAGIRRYQTFITNVLHVRPPDNKFEWAYKKANVHHYFEGVLQLKKDLEEIRPNLILALGNHAMRALTNKTGITDWRGSVLPCTLVPGLKVLPTVHPAFILRAFDYKAIAKFDFKRALKEMQYPDIRRPKREYHLNPSDRTQMIQEMLNAEYLSIDIEGSINHLRCVGFSDSAKRSLVIPWRTESDKLDIRVLCESNVPKVMQNGTYDATVMAVFGVTIKNFAWDTMIAHHSLFPESAGGEDELSRHAGKKKLSAFKKGLAFQTSIYTDEPYYKPDWKWNEEIPDNDLWTYNATDSAVTREIRDVQERELIDFRTLDTFKHGMSLVEPLMHMTSLGIKIDMAKRSQFERELNDQLTNAQKELDKAAGESVNVKSNKQMAELLFGKLKFKPSKVSAKTLKPSADKDVIADIIGKYPGHHIVKHIGTIREIRDLLERYVNTPLDQDGRMRCAWDITGTRTGRLASRMSIWGSGTNLQNQPNVIRSMFVPDDGKCFLNADYSQAEIRLVAYLANCQAMIDVFTQGRDIHRENASRIFHISGDLVSYTQRYLAKKFGHAADYGMHGKKAAAIVNQEADGTSVMLDGMRVSPGTGVRATVQEAEAIIAAYFMLYPEIKEVYWGNIKHDLDRSMTLTTPFGRRRQFFGRKDDKLLNEAYAFTPQSLVGDLCCKALVRAYHAFKAMPELGADVLLNVHDSILVQCNIGKESIVARILKECMTIPIQIRQHTVYIPIDIALGFNWGSKGKDGSNPKGLAEIKLAA